jgi:hypothetical protein
MQYRRLHIRVPASGSAILSIGEEIRVEATVINVSAGGFCLAAPSHLLDQVEYHIEIVTPSCGKIQFSGLPVYQTEDSVGTKITSIDKDNLKKIYQLVQEFELTEDFIKQIEERNLLKDWLVDETGNDLTITFESEPDRQDQKGDPKFKKS